MSLCVLRRLREYTIYESLTQDNINLLTKDHLLVEFIGTIPPSNNTWYSNVPNNENAIEAKVTNLDFDGESFLLDIGKGIEIPIRTSAYYQNEVSFEIWVKKVGDLPNGSNGWIMSQTPDWGWSRSLSINDSRLGYIGVTPGRTSGSGKKLENNKWTHLVGTFNAGNIHRGGSVSPENYVFVNGVRYKCRRGGNRTRGNKVESLSIPRMDSRHNVKNVRVSCIRVWNKALTSDEVNHLYGPGNNYHLRSAVENNLEYISGLENKIEVLETNLNESESNLERLISENSELQLTYSEEEEAYEKEKEETRNEFNSKLETKQLEINNQKEIISKLKEQISRLGNIIN